MNSEEVKEYIAKTIQAEDINKQPINEFANSKFCGIEVTDDICVGSVQDKVIWMVNRIDKTAENDKIVGYKVSNVKIIKRENYYTHKQKTYNVTITMGETDANNIIKPSTGFGLYHLRYKKDSYKRGKNHWKESKEILKYNLQDFINSPVEDYYDDKGNIQPAKVKININGNFFLIGLDGYGSIHDDETILITCYHN